MNEIAGVIFVFVVSALIAKVIQLSLGGNNISSSNYSVDNYDSDNCNDFWDDYGCDDSWGNCDSWGICDSDCGCDSDGGDCGCD
ncbi:hypothetical protein KCL46_001212 [Clostridium perfringens]|nr:hypothetical protein [Clostridium perfringens]